MNIPPERTDSLISRLVQGGIHDTMADVELRNIDISGLCIKSRLLRAKIINVKCEGTLFCQLDRATFFGATGSSIDIWGADNCEFERCKFTRALLRGTVSNCKFMCCDMPHSHFMFRGDSIWRGPNIFRNCNLQAFDARGCDLSAFTFEGCILKEARLSRARLKGIRLCRCDLTDCDIAGVRVAKQACERFARGVDLDRYETGLASLQTRSITHWRAVERELRPVKDYSVRWQFARGKRQRELVCIWRDAHVAKMRGVYAVIPGQPVMRTYDWSARRELARVGKDVLADFWRWRPLVETIEITGCKPSTRAKVRAALQTLLFDPGWGAYK